VKVQFELLGNGEVKAIVNYEGDDRKRITVEGTKTLKYPA